MTKWSHLPNSHYIDWVIDSVKKDTQLWAKASLAKADLVDLMIEAAMTAMIDIAQNGTRYEAWAALTNVGLTSDRIDGHGNEPSIALVAYDDCEQYINMSYEKLLVYAELSEKPQAILLLPMVYVREKLNESMVTPT